MEWLVVRRGGGDPEVDTRGGVPGFGSGVVTQTHV
jgi:hypothetical protein